MRTAFVVFMTCSAALGDLAYYNDFDAAETFGSGVSVTVSGGTGTAGGFTGGITDSQGYKAYSGFGGDFWRVTQPNDVLAFDVSGVANSLVSVDVSLAMIDSWDGTQATYGTDIINVAIFDGSNQIAGISEPYFGGTAPSSNVESIIVQNVQLGFNSASNSWWNDDGYRLSFNNLPYTGGILSVQFWASSAGSGSGFQGGNDESFAIDELRITATPEPSLTGYLLLVGTTLACRRRTVRSRD